MHVLYSYVVDGMYNVAFTRAGLSLNFLSWAYVRHGALHHGVWYARVIDFRHFRTLSLTIFGKILGLLETTKMYKLF